MEVGLKGVEERRGERRDGCKTVWSFGFLVDGGFRYEIETLSEANISVGFHRVLSLP